MKNIEKADMMYQKSVYINPMTTVAAPISIPKGMKTANTCLVAYLAIHFLDRRKVLKAAKSCATAKTVPFISLYLASVTKLLNSDIS